MELSFERSHRAKPKVANLDELSAALSRIVSIHHKLAGLDEGPSSFLDHVAESVDHARYNIGHHLNVVDKATRAGTITWHDTREPRLVVDGHPDL